jgi:hypothetical protein
MLISGKGGDADKVVGTLLTQGLIEEIPARGALPIWRRDEGKGPFALRITTRGLAARVDEHRAFLETQERAASGKGPILRATSLPIGPLRRVAKKPETRLCDSRASPAVGTQSRPNPRPADGLDERIGWTIGTVSDVVGSAAFFASDEARYCNGAAIPIDGGYLAV